ncbi:MAG: cupin domain-containing protein [bacterium]|nr:cupin domain-containing protein [bacterium]
MENREKIKKKLTADGYATIYEYDDGPGEKFSEHSHEGEQLMFIMAGEMKVEMNGKTYRLKFGDSLLFPANALHSAKIGAQGCSYIVGEK